MRTLLHRFNSTRSPLQSHTQSHNRRRKFRNQLRFERLENRITLDAQAVHWDGGGNDLLWNNPLNWSNDNLPGLGDDVSIGSLASASPILISTNNASVHSLTADHAILVQSTLTLGSTSAFGNDLTVFGTIVSSGQINVLGGFKIRGVLSGANGQGSLIASGGTEINEMNLTNGFHFINPSGTTVTANGQVYLYNNDTLFENLGTYDLWTDNGISTSDGLQSSFTNSGTLIKHVGSTDRNLFYGSLIGVSRFTNSGTIEVREGTLGLSGTTLSDNSGSLKGLPTTTLWLLDNMTSTGTIDVDRVRIHVGTKNISGSFKSNEFDIYDGRSTVIMSGTIVQLGEAQVGSSGVHAVLDITNATLLNPATTFSSLTLNGNLVTDENLTIAGPFKIRGVLSGANGQGSLIASSGTEITEMSLTNGFHFINPSGTTVTANGQVYLYNNDTLFENLGIYDLWTDNGISTSDGLQSSFTNSGTLIKHVGSTDRNLFYGSLIGVSRFTNSGTIEVREGTLGLSGITLSDNSGSLKGLPTTTLWLLDNMTSTGTIDVDRVRIHVGTKNISGSFKSNEFDIYDGRSTVIMSGTIVQLGEAQVGSSGVHAVLDITNATLLNPATTFSSLTLNGNLVTDENLTIAGPFKIRGVLSGANGQGSLIASSGTEITEMSLTNGFHFINPSGTTVTANGQVYLYNNDTLFENLGIYDLWTDNGISTSDGLQSSFTNSGTLIKHVGSTDRNLFYGSLIGVSRFTNSGTIEVREGTLGLSGTTLSDNSGSLKGLPTTTLWLLDNMTSTGTIDVDRVRIHVGTKNISGSIKSNEFDIYDGRSTVIMSGTIVQLGEAQVGSSGVHAVLDITNATLLNPATTFSSLTLNGNLITDENLTIAGPFKIRGVLSGANGQGSLIASGGTEITEMSLTNGFHFINPSGTTVTANGQVYLYNNDTLFENLGTYDLWTDNGISTSDGLQSSFTNSGTLIKHVGSTDRNLFYGSLIGVSRFTNSGTIEVREGTLGLSGTTLSDNSGSLKGLPTTTLWLLDNMTSTGTIDVDRVRIHVGTKNISGSFKSNEFDIYDGRSTVIMSGTIVQLGEAQVGSSGVHAVLDITNATLLNPATTFSSLTLNGNLITDENLTIAGPFKIRGVLSGANGQGSLIASGGTEITEMSLTNGFHFINPSGTTVTANGQVYLYNNDTLFENLGIYDLWTDNGISTSDGLQSSFTNSGTLIKHVGSTDRNLFYGSLIGVSRFTNSGTIEVREGTLGLSVTTLSDNSGSLKGLPTTTLWLLDNMTSTGTIDVDRVRIHVGTKNISGSFKSNEFDIYDGRSTVIMSGTIVQLGEAQVGSSGVHAVLDITNATLLNPATTFSSLTLNGNLITDENLTIAGPFKIRGVLSGANGQGSLIASGGTEITEMSLTNGFHFINPSGTTVTANGQVYLYNNDTLFENLGIYDLWTDNGISTSDGLQSSFTNSGTLIKHVGSTDRNLFYGSLIGVSRFTNSGTIEVREGTLGLSGTTLSDNSGSLKGLPTTTLWLLDNMTSTGTIDVDRVRIHVGTKNISGSIKSNEFDIYDGRSTVIMSGTIVQLGEAQVGSSGVHAVLDITNATLSNPATTFSSLTLNGNLVTDENLTVFGTFRWLGGELRGVNGNGSLKVGSNTTLQNSVSLQDFDLINAANMTWSGGSVQFSGNGSGFVNATGAIFEDQVDGSFGSVDGYCVRFQNDGQFIKSGLLGITNLQMQLYNRGAVEIQRGRLFVGCGYASDNPSNPPVPGIEYPVDHPPVYEDPNPRSLPPDNPVVVPGTYTQTVTGLLIEQIAGHSGTGPYGIPGTDYGQLAVNGDVALDGAFQVQVIGGFVPTVGQQYLVIDNRGTKPIAGKFIGLPEGEIVWAGNYGFVISYVGGNGNDVVLTMDRFANSPPVADAGGPYNVAEGGSIALSAANSRDEQQPTASLVFAWDLDGDGIFGEVGSSAARGNENVINPTFSALGLDGPSNYPVNLRVTDEFGAMATASAMINVFNVAPRVTLTGTASATEGSTRNYLFASSDPGIDTFEIVATSGGAFGIVSNIQFDSATGMGSFDVKFTDGPANSVVTVQLRDSDGATSNSSILVAVTNVAPVITTIASSNADLAHVSTTGNVNLNGTYFDPALGFDTHTVRVNWGDGSPVETLPASSVNQTLDAFQRIHHYANGGIYTISVTVLDEEGGVSATATSTAVVYGLGLVNGTLYIIGTEGSDEVELEYSANTNLLTVEIELDEDSGCDDEIELTQTYNASTITRIVTWLLGGDDEYESDDDVSLPQIVFGGAGDDEIQGGKGNDALMGGSGNDEIKGGLGRDLLVGGIGRDNLKGQSGDDVLVGGSVANQDSLAAIDQALASWSTGSLNATLLYLGSIIDDLEKDELSGDAGSDQLFGGLGDKLKQ